MAEPRKVLKKKIPEMKVLLKIISNLLSGDDKFTLEELHFDTSKLVRDDEDEDSECSSEARTFALNLFYFSPKAYKFVISQYDSCLPPVSTLRTWFVHEGGDPGFTAETLDAIGEKAKQSQNKIYCSLIIRDYDEYHAAVQYVDGEGYYGFHNVGTEMDTDCNNTANTALVFTVAAITASWSLPIGYFLLYGDSKDKIASLVNTAIFLLEQKGVEVTTLSLEWGSYKNVATALGCKLPINTTNMKLVKFISESNKDIIVVPDIRKWLNEILSFWEATDELKDFTGSSIAWKYVEELESKTGQTPKRKNTQSYAWDYDPDEVPDRVVEVSDAVTDRFIKILQHKHLFKSQNIPEAEATIKFLTFIDDILDIFNLKPNNPDQKRIVVNNETKTIVTEKLEAICGYFATVQPSANRFANFSAFYVATKGVLEIIRLYLDGGILENISLDKITFEPSKDIFAKIKRGSGTEKGRDVSARRFKMGYNEDIKELLLTAS